MVKEPAIDAVTSMQYDFNSTDKTVQQTAFSMAKSLHCRQTLRTARGQGEI
jgi:hypothetical protein